MDLKQKLADLVQSTGAKHLGHAIKRDQLLLAWINLQTQQWPMLSLSQRVRCILHHESPMCEHSNQLKAWKSMHVGFGFCGKAAQCACAASSVSSKIKAVKQGYSPQQKQQITEKREQTNLAKYGVSNSGQTEAAKQAHAQVYADPHRVKQIVETIQQTCVTRLGVNNPMQSPAVRQKAENTTKARYGVSNINQLPERKQAIGDLSRHTWQQRKHSHFDYHKLSEKLRELHQVQFATPADQYQGTVGSHRYQFSCITCGHQFEDRVGCGHIPVCRMCNPKPTPKWCSNQEMEVCSFVTSLGVAVETSNRSLINPFELDIVVHSHKLAIEYCGLYWHSELGGGKSKIYHKQKLAMCQAKGYDLVTIFSDEWMSKPRIVQAKLSHLLGMNTAKIDARKCQLVTVAGGEAKTFVEANHIQGWAPGGTVHLGLRDQTKLVALISMGGLRRFTNNAAQEGSWELLRYATCAHVRGGASRLLTAFERSHQPKRIVSFADARWSTGGLYRQLGFDLIHHSDPGYWYTPDYVVRQHRSAHMKGSLIKQGFDAALTEWEIQKTRGYDRIWDCGQLKFEKTL